MQKAVPLTPADHLRKHIVHTLDATRLSTPASSPATLLRQVSGKVERFLRWLADQGASFPGMAVRASGNGVEICASRNVQANRLLMFIPRRLMITCDQACDSEFARLIQPHVLPEDAYIAAFLLHARKGPHFFTPYLDLLPRDISHLPTHWPSSDLACLQGTYALRKVADLVENMRSEYRVLAARLPPHLSFSMDDYAWAKSIVRSRLLRVGYRNEVALVPLADMMEHAPDSNAGEGGESRLGFFCTAARTIGAGARLTRSYGPIRGNGTFFAYYGFAVPGNPNDDTCLHFPAPRGPLACELTQGLGQADGAQRMFAPIACCDDARSRSMLAYLRLCHAASPVDAATAFDAPLDRDNELTALDALAAACRRRMSDFAKIDEPDDWGTQATPRQRLALLVRDGELRVLRYLLGLADAGRAFLTGQPVAPGFGSYLRTLQPLTAESTRSRGANAGRTTTGTAR